jgi:hypothetical protein
MQFSFVLFVIGLVASVNCQMFTAVTHLQSLLSAESQLISKINEYLEIEEQRLDHVRE